MVADLQKIEWWKPEELAARWRVSASTIHRMHRDNPESFGRMFRGCLRIHHSTIESYERQETHRQVITTLHNERRNRRHRQRRSVSVEHFAAGAKGSSI